MTIFDPVDYSDPKWNLISPDAIDFTKKWLIKNP